MFDLVAHLERQRQFSFKTFGPGTRTAGTLDHIRKECGEIERAPHDLEEWVDLILLAFDGAWRSGHRPEEIVAALDAKQSKNEARDWPDWRTSDPNKAIEHVRRDAFTVPAGHTAVRDDDGRATGEVAPMKSPHDCPLVSCGSPYLCRVGCRIIAVERGS